MKGWIIEKYEEIKNDSSNVFDTSAIITLNEEEYERFKQSRQITEIYFI